MTAEPAGTWEEYGFEEIEPGLIEDSSSNRRRLMRMDPPWSWDRVRDEDGHLTGYIRPVTPEQITTARHHVYEQRRPLLVDPNDKWSDYVHPDEYPIDHDLPYWVDLRLQKWKQDAREGIPESERRPFPTRCSQIRVDGTRCWLWVNRPQETSKCSKHQGLTREAVERTPGYARLRILESSLVAADRLEYLVENGETHAVQLKASTEILDRAGVRGGVDIDIEHHVEVTDPADALKQRLHTLSERVIQSISASQAEPAEEIVEAEVVPDDSN